MTTPVVTILTIPRERYSGMLPSIDSLYQHTADTAFEHIVIDGHLPEDIRRGVEQRSKDHGFRFIHKDYRLTSNEARNIGVGEATSRYVVFADNDVTYTPHWLPPSLNAADEFEAWLVGPTILDGDLERGRIHAAGGDSQFEEIDGKRSFSSSLGFMHQKLSDVKDDLARGPATMLEFHVMMARRDIFETIGPLDEEITSFADHEDLVIGVRNAGGAVIFEPASIVSYLDPMTNPDVLEEADLPMFLLRWSDEWNIPSIHHAAKKWKLDSSDRWISHVTNWIQIRRRKAYKLGGLSGRLVGFVYYRISKSLGRRLERKFCERYTLPLKATRSAAGVRSLS